MAIGTQEWIDELKGISVLELSERIKALEEAFGVSATRLPPRRRRPAAAAAAARPRRSRRLHGLPRGDRRQEDPGHQGRARGDRPWPQGGQGPRREAPKEIKEGIERAEADELKQELEEAGATVELR